MRTWLTADLRGSPGKEGAICARSFRWRLVLGTVCFLKNKGVKGFHNVDSSSCCGALTGVALYARRGKDMQIFVWVQTLMLKNKSAGR